MQHGGKAALRTLPRLTLRDRVTDRFFTNISFVPWYFSLVSRTIPSFAMLKDPLRAMLFSDVKGIIMAEHEEDGIVLTGLGHIMAHSSVTDSILFVQSSASVKRRWMVIKTTKSGDSERKRGR